MLNEVAGLNGSFKTLKTTDLCIDKLYTIHCAKIVQTRLYGVKVVMSTNEGEYWLPPSYGNKIAADKVHGDVIRFEPNIVMQFKGFKPNSPKTPILFFQ